MYAHGKPWQDKNSHPIGFAWDMNAHPDASKMSKAHPVTQAGTRAHTLPQSTSFKDREGAAVVSIFQLLLAQ
jgi:hypothetical protein